MDLLRLALALTGGGLAPPPRRSLAETASAIAAAAFAALAVVAAVACVAVALWIGVRPWVGPIGAPLVVAAALLVLALVAATLARRALRPPAPAVAVPVTTSGSNEALLVEAARLVKAHKVPILLAAVLAGVAAGMRETGMREK